MTALLTTSRQMAWSSPGRCWGAVGRLPWTGHTTALHRGRVAPVSRAFSATTQCTAKRASPASAPAASSTKTTKTVPTKTKTTKTTKTAKTGPSKKTQPAPEQEKEKKKATKTPKSKATKPAELPPAPSDIALPSLKLAQLQDVAVLCGRNQAGTKAQLCADLTAALALGTGPATTTTATTTRRVLSVDMGVRNLAYCLLETGDAGQPARLLAWERLSLVGDKAATDLDKEAMKALFAPPRLAALATELVRTRLLPLAPTHVLVEHQRSRSGSGAAVLEWTLRVNALESMLHGILAFCRHEHRLEEVAAISPRRASNYLLRTGGRDMQGAPALPVAAKEKMIKDIKQAFVGGLLWAADEADDEVDTCDVGKRLALVYDDAVRPMVEAYLLRLEGKEARKSASTTTEKSKKPRKTTTPDTATTESLPVLGKIDDLADCVAQGLIWLEWERNKATLATHGATTLLADRLLA